jgi:hypothetical protein
MTKRDPKRTSKTKKRGFDVLKWKARAQAKIYNEIKDMTIDEEVAYWRAHAEKGPRGAKWKKLHAQTPADGRNALNRTRRRKSG